MVWVNKFQFSNLLNNLYQAYVPADAEIQAMAETIAEKSNLEDQKAIEELQAQKAALQNELRIIEKTVKATREGDAVLG